MKVLIVKDWDFPNLLRQTPGMSGQWKDMSFELANDGECDFLIILNRTPIDINVLCNPQNVWAILQEPPVPEYRWLFEKKEKVDRIITPGVIAHNEKVVSDHPALPWHVNKTYDELVAIDKPTSKEKNLSWVTSNAKGRMGHKRRMAFLNNLKKRVDFDLYGRGFNQIDDKWNALYPYKYSLAVENHSSPFYWTEKISDCFLSWTMPIYYGCTNIDDYFPRESYISIDINDHKKSAEIIQEAIGNRLWEKNIDAIEFSRNKVLNEYQIFPYLYRKLNSLNVSNKEDVFIPAQSYEYPSPLIVKISNFLKSRVVR